MKTKIRTLTLAVILLGAFSWYFVWPIAGPFILQYLPLPGANEITAIELANGPTGNLTAKVTYFYTGRPNNVYLRGRVMGDPAVANGEIGESGNIVYQGSAYTMAVRGAHSVTLVLERPPVRGEVNVNQVVVGLYVEPKDELVTTRSIKRHHFWPDSDTWALDNEILAKPHDEVLKKASALIDAGDTRSLVAANAIVKRLIAHDPKYQPALEEALRIADKAIWQPKNIARLSSRVEIFKVVNALKSFSAFDELDDLATNMREAKSMTANGYPALALYYEQLARRIDDPDISIEKIDEQIKRSENEVGKWLKKRPESSAAHLEMAKTFFDAGWMIRGSGYANSVTEEKWKGYKEYMEKSRAYLTQCYTVCRADPEWYRLMLAVMRSSSESGDLYFRTFVEGFEKFPEYSPIYTEFAFRLTPKWGGTVQLFENFAKEVASKFPTNTGDAAYARIYFDAADWPENPKFSEWKVNCPRLIRGHDEIVAKFPTDYNFNVAAFTAMLCTDAKATKRFLAKIRNSPDLRIWGSTTEEATKAFARAVALAK